MRHGGRPHGSGSTWADGIADDSGDCHCKDITLRAYEVTCINIDIAQNGRLLLDRTQVSVDSDDRLEVKVPSLRRFGYLLDPFPARH